MRHPRCTWSHGVLGRSVEVCLALISTACKLSLAVELAGSRAASSLTIDRDFNDRGLMVDEVHELSLPTFSEKDCALLSKFAADKPLFNEIQPHEKSHYRDMRSRLEALARIGAER